MVIVYGLPTELHEEDQNCEHGTLRGHVWRVLLGVEEDAVRTDLETPKQKYRRAVKRGPSKSDSEIRNDTFRTFRGDASFARRVPEDKLVRVLNAFIHEYVRNIHYLIKMYIFVISFRYGCRDSVMIVEMKVNSHFDIYPFYFIFNCYGRFLLNSKNLAWIL